MHRDHRCKAFLCFSHSCDLIVKPVNDNQKSHEKCSVENMRTNNLFYNVYFNKSSICRQDLLTISFLSTNWTHDEISHHITTHATAHHITCNITSSHCILQHQHHITSIHQHHQWHHSTPFLAVLLVHFLTISWSVSSIEWRIVFYYVNLHW